MHTTFTASQMEHELIEAFQNVKDIASRLQRAFSKIEDDAILDGKAIPLAKLLHSVLRTQIQLATKIERCQALAGNDVSLAKNGSTSDRPTASLADPSCRVHSTTGNSSTPQRRQSKKPKQHSEPTANTTGCHQTVLPGSSPPVFKSHDRPFGELIPRDSRKVTQKPAHGLLMR